MNGLDFRQSLHLGALATAQHPGECRVVVEHTFERVHDLIVERRLRTLGQATDEDPHAVDRVELPDPVFGEDVHHAGRQTAIGDDGDSLFLGSGIQRLLLEDDLGIPAQIRKVHAGIDRELGEVVIEVVRNRAHRRVGLTHQRQHSFLIPHIDRREDQTLARVRRQEVFQMIRVQIGQSNFFYLRVLQQIICARGALKARAKY